MNLSVLIILRRIIFNSYVLQVDKKYKYRNRHWIFFVHIHTCKGIFCSSSLKDIFYELKRID